MKVLAKMSADVVSVSIDDDIGMAYDLMVDGNFRHIPVLNDGVVVGVLSDRDILLHATGGRHNIKVPSLAVSEVMTRHPITCLPGLDVAQAAAIMLERRIDCLPVVSSDGALVGMFTSADILDIAACSDDDPVTIEVDSSPASRRTQRQFGEEAFYNSPFLDGYGGPE